MTGQIKKRVHREGGRGRRRVGGEKGDKNNTAFSFSIIRFYWSLHILSVIIFPTLLYPIGFKWFIDLLLLDRLSRKIRQTSNNLKHNETINACSVLGLTVYPVETLLLEPRGKITTFKITNLVCSVPDVDYGTLFPFLLWSMAQARTRGPQIRAKISVRISRYEVLNYNENCRILSRFKAEHS